MGLDVDRCDIANQATFFVLMMDFFDNDVNRQSAYSGDRLAHQNLRFLSEFVEKKIAESEILENPLAGKDVVDGIAFFN